MLKKSSKNDRIDARKLADLLRLKALKAVYHGEHGTRTLKELVRCYECLVKDLSRVQNRLKALYNSQAIPNRGGELYHLSKRESWIQKQENAGRRMRAELLFRQMDDLKGEDMQHLGRGLSRNLGNALGRHFERVHRAGRTDLPDPSGYETQERKPQPCAE